MVPNILDKVVDELVIMSEFDPDLKAGLEYLDKQALKEGIDLNEKIFRVLHHTPKQELN